MLLRDLIQQATKRNNLSDEVVVRIVRVAGMKRTFHTAPVRVVDDLTDGIVRFIVDMDDIKPELPEEKKRGKAHT